MINELNEEIGNSSDTSSNSNSEYDTDQSQDDTNLMKKKTNNVIKTSSSEKSDDSKGDEMGLIQREEQQTFSPNNVFRGQGQGRRTKKLTTMSGYNQMAF